MRYFKMKIEKKKLKPMIKQNYTMELTNIFR